MEIFLRWLQYGCLCRDSDYHTSCFPFFGSSNLDQLPYELQSLLWIGAIRMDMGVFMGSMVRALPKPLQRIHSLY